MSDSQGSGANHTAGNTLPPALAAYSEYEVVWELGRGGMGVVYLARNRLMDRYEALKVRTGPGHSDEFLSEVQASARLTHPNLVTVYSARVILDTLILAMEYIDGCDLARLVAERGSLPVPDACELIRQAALGLQHAHDAGVIHRDIKPANLILAHSSGQLTIKVLDFGLARARDDGREISAGTPAFAAPEQFAEPMRVDARSDLYALGGTFFFLLTGDTPFPSQTRRELLRQHREDPVPRADEVRDGVPVEVADLIEQMMAKDPDDRPQTAAEVARVLTRYADAGEPIRSWVAARPAGAETVTRASAMTPIIGESLSQAPTVNMRALPPRVATRRRRLLSGLATAALAAMLCAGWASHGDIPDSPGNPDGFAAAAQAPVSLFDGCSLNGWIVDGGAMEEWWVEDGAIGTTATRSGPRSWLLTEREFGDFRVRFEYRLAPGANTGFAFRAVPGECPVIRGNRPTATPYHQQIEISDDASPRWALLPTGQVNGSGISTGPALKPHRTAQAPAEEWNWMEIEMRGSRIRVHVNDEEILDDDLTRLIEIGSPYPALHRVRGRIGFQQQARTAEFRNITIVELGP